MILFVCTGNICRSAMAEGLLAAGLGRVGSDLLVASAGTAGDGAAPATEHAVSVLADRGVDISTHRSRGLSAAMVGEADLIVAMTRVHASAVAALDQATRSRTFLVGEVVRLGGTIGAAAGTSLRDWVVRLDSARGGHMTTGRLADEIPDPYGQARAAYEDLADRLTGTCEALTRMLEPAG